MATPLKSAVGIGSLPASPFSAPTPTPIGDINAGGSFAPRPTAQPLQSASQSFPAASVPDIGQDQLPDDFAELQASFKGPDKPGLLKSLGKGIADIALQPARALEQIGKFFGTLGLSEEQKKRVDEFMGPGLQERALGKDYATPTPTSGRQATGIALKAGANLATPFAINPLGMAVQGAAAGSGEALEKGRSDMAVVGEGLMGAGINAILGKVINTGGAVVGRGFAGAKNELAQSLRPIADKIGPTLTGTTRKEFDMVFKESPHIIADYLNTIKGAATAADAEVALQGRLLQNAREIVDSAKKIEGDAFNTAITTFNNKHPEVRVSIDDIKQGVINAVDDIGTIPVNAEEEYALNQISKIFQRERPNTVDGTRTLLQDLFAFSDRLEPGSPAQRIATDAWNKTRNRLTETVKQFGEDGTAFESAMARYSDFKGNIDQVRPIYSPNENTARSFVRNLAGTNKTASREALMKLDQIAGGTEAIPAIDIYRLVSRLTAEGKVTGSRVQDIMIGGSAIGGLSALGGALGGPAGSALGTLAGTALAGKAMAPSTITDIMLSQLRGAGIKPTSAVRQALEQIINNPTWRQAILNMLQGQNEAQK